MALTPYKWDRPEMSDTDQALQEWIGQFGLKNALGLDEQRFKKDEAERLGEQFQQELAFKKTEANRMSRQFQQEFGLRKEEADRLADQWQQEFGRSGEQWEKQFGLSQQEAERAAEQQRINNILGAMGGSGSSRSGTRAGQGGTGTDRQRNRLSNLLYKELGVPTVNPKTGMVPQDYTDWLGDVDEQIKRYNKRDSDYYRGVTGNRTA